VCIITPMETSNLRKKIKHLMVDLDLGHGSQKILAETLAVNENSLNMALTGYRTGPASVQLLMTVLNYLGYSKLVEMGIKKYPYV